MIANHVQGETSAEGSNPSLSATREGSPPAGAARLAFETGRLLVFDKPPGLSLATRRDEPGAAVERLVRALPPEDAARWLPDLASLRLVHRLDVGTTGLVLVARDADMHRALSRAFERREVGKTYLALAWGKPRPRAGVLDAPLGPDRRDRRRMRVDAQGRPALTRYETLATPGQASLVRLLPQTGRTHQIRVHLAAAGHPIVGDDLYGGPRHRGVRDRGLREALCPPHALLHAHRLVIPALAGASALDMITPPPPAFMRALKALGVVLADVVE